MKKGYVFSLVLALFACMAFSQELQITRYALSDEKLEQSVTLAVVSDLHNSVFGKGQSELAEAIHAARPDAVLFTGDMAEDLDSLSATRMLAEALGGKYPVYAVTGNHECISGELDAIRAELRGMGIKVLAGESEILPCGMRIAGVDNPTKETWEEWRKQGYACRFDDDVFTVLLSHRPDLIKYYREDFDLTLTGHAHGGQLRIPGILPDGLWAPNQGWFPEYTRGLHAAGEGKMIVSRGLSKGFPPRVFNRPELVIVELNPAP